ncbi:unnamed protein product [Leptosia nina]|uniref:Cuticle protein n=1 Tax=Leptosia nina TaxID=320188 RepID=A0AAV1JQD6_9NEOP
MSRLLWMQSLLLLNFIASSYTRPLGASHRVIPVTTIEQANYPQYAFSYAVHDPHTNDNKAQWETRNGDEVNGEYSLLDPDGTVRVVKYNANDHKGFTAVVNKIGASVHPTNVVSNVPVVLNPAPPVAVHAVRDVPVRIPLLPPPPTKIHISHEVPVHPTKVSVTQHVGPSISYGAGGVNVPVGVSHVVYQRGSLPWDPHTGSFGGWRPLHGPITDEPYATIIARKYIDGNLHKIITGPINLAGKTLYIRKSHR